LLLRLLELRVVRCVAAILRAPRRVGQTKLDPAKLGSIQLALVDTSVGLVRARVRALRVLRLRFGLELRVVGLLHEGVEDEEEKGRDGDSCSFHSRIPNHGLNG